MIDLVDLKGEGEGFSCLVKVGLGTLCDINKIKSTVKCHGVWEHDQIIGTRTTGFLSCQSIKQNVPYQKVERRVIIFIISELKLNAEMFLITF